MASSTVMVDYRFRGYDYHVTLSVGDEKRKEEAMTIEVEDSATADQWRATFSADYIQGGCRIEETPCKIQEVSSFYLEHVNARQDSFIYFRFDAKNGKLQLKLTYE